MASVGPLEAWWSKKARMSARRRHRVRPSWAISSSPAGTPRRTESIKPGHRAFPAAAVRVSVGGDDLLIDHICEFDGEVFLGVEHGGQAVVLAGRKAAGCGCGRCAPPAYNGSPVSPRRPRVCCWMRWRHRSSEAPARATTWNGLCRYRHNPFYAEVRIMPMWVGRGWSGR